MSAGLIDGSPDPGGSGWTLRRRTWYARDQVGACTAKEGVLGAPGPAQWEKRRAGISNEDVEGFRS